MASDELVERWPGYNEQSWAERFAELDLRYRMHMQMLAGLGLRPRSKEREE